MATPIFALDTSYRYLAFNRAHDGVMHAIYGRHPAVGTALPDLQRPEDWAVARLNLDRALAGEVVRAEGYSGEGPSRRYFEVVHSPIVEDDGSIVGCAVVALDTTEQRMRTEQLAENREELTAMVEELTAAEEEVRRLNTDLELRVAERTSELEEANRELRASQAATDQFLANMSHELRTPLNSIIGFSGVLLSGTPGEMNDEQRAQLSMILASGRHLLAIISDLLDLSAIEAGRTALETSPVEVGALVAEVAAAMTPLAAERGITLESYLPDAPLVITTDPTRIRQILLNLAGNAVKFTEAGCIEIRSGRSGRAVTISVRDDGPGLEPEDLERVFEPFAQGSAGRLAKAPGVGLGLAISRRLAEALGGRIDVESAPGEGSTFTLVLPAS